MQSMPTSTHRRWLTLLTTILLLLSQATTVFAATPIAISQAGSNNDTPAEEGTLGDAETQPTEADPANAVQDLEGVETAVVQIEAVGTFRDPQEGLMVNAAGRGSGFIIDPSGIAVTNNHVVTGAGLLKVYVAGEKKARNARVLGVSECSDLAVIDIQGDGFPYLTWYEKPIKVGLDIYAAGFPLGDPEYTLVKGIVAKAKADGDTNWASVEHVIQHDAAINPGNSGGPLVTKDGLIVGVNYAGNSETQQAFAIAEDVTRPIVQQLRTGLDLDSIGLNATAVSNGKDFAGIWVSSVASGSPADKTGILPGDIIMSMEGISLASDGTMKDYCDILRSHDPLKDTLSIEVLRSDTKEMMQGQLNGRPLETSFSLADQVQEEGNSPDSGNQGSSETITYTNYVTISDTNHIVTMDVPEEWSDVREGDWKVDDKVVGFRLFASPDLDHFSDDWSIPGVIFGYSEELADSKSPEDLVNDYDYSKDCKTEGKVDAMPDGFFVGNYKSWNDCGKEGGSSVLLVGLTPAENPGYVVLLEVYAASQADLDATDRILDSFVVAGTADNGAQTTDNGAASTVSEDDVRAAVDTSGLRNEYAFVNNAAIGGLIPSDWQDQTSEDWTSEDKKETYGVIFKASADLKGFDETWETAGISVRSATGLTEDIDVNNWLDSDVEALKDDCKYDKKRKVASHDIVGQSWEGKYDVFTKCGKANNSYYVAALNSVPTGNFVYVLFMTVNSADREAFDVFMKSFFLEAPTTAQGPAVEASALVSVTDDTEQITINVPTAWNDLKSEDWMGNDNVLGPSFYAAEDVSKFGEDYTVPGLFVGVGPGLMENVTIDKMLDSLQDVFNSDCTYNDRYDYEDEKLTGAIDTFTECGDVKGEVLSVLAAAPKDNPSTLVVVFVNSPTADDTVDFAQVLQPLDVADVTLDTSGNNGSTTSSGIGDGNSDSGNSDSGNSDSGNTDSGNSDSGSDTPVTTVTVVAQTLNVREGPGTNYKAVTTVKKNDELGVIGMAQNCAWLYVLTPSVDMGWVAGTAQYVKFSDGSSCADLQDVSALAPPAPSGSTGSSGSQSGSANAKKGCIQFQNHIGAEATVTMTNKGNGKAETFKVAKDKDFDKCFDPGKYAMTIDVPPPWGSLNADLELSAGDYYAYPIEGEK